jgi:hypothetical protein
MTQSKQKIEYKMTSRQNDKLAKWQAGKMTSWQNDKAQTESVVWKGKFGKWLVDNITQKKPKE